MCILNLGADNRQNMAAHMAAAQKLADDISKTFPPPVELEFEKARLIHDAFVGAAWRVPGGG